MSQPALQATAAPPVAADKPALRLWLRLLACTNQIEGAVRADLRQAFGATLPRFDLLAQLARAPEGLAMGELSRRLMVSNGNVTGIVDRLVVEGLVVRLTGPKDRRFAFVRLTPAGKAAFDRMAGPHEAWINGIFGALTAEQQEQLAALLAILKRSAAAHRRQENDA